MFQLQLQWGGLVNTIYLSQQKSSQDALDEDIEIFKALVETFKSSKDNCEFEKNTKLLTVFSKQLNKKIQNFDLKTKDKLNILDLFMTETVITSLTTTNNKYVTINDRKNFPKNNTNNWIKVETQLSSDNKTRSWTTNKHVKSPSEQLLSTLIALDKTITTKINGSTKNKSNVQPSKELDQQINYDLDNIISYLKPLYLDQNQIKQSELNKEIRKFEKLIKQFTSEVIVNESVLMHKSPKLTSAAKNLKQKLENFGFTTNSKFSKQTYDKLYELMSNTALPTLQNTFNHIFNDSKMSEYIGDTSRDIKLNIDDKNDCSTSQPEWNKLIDSIDKLDTEIVGLKKFLSEESVSKENPKKNNEQTSKVIISSFKLVDETMGSLKIGDELQRWFNKLRIKHQAKQFDKSMKVASDYLKSASAKIYNTIKSQESVIKETSLFFGGLFTDGLLSVSEWAANNINNVHHKVSDQQLAQFIKDVSKNLPQTSSTTYVVEKWSVPKSLSHTTSFGDVSFGERWDSEEIYYSDFIEEFYSSPLVEIDLVSYSSIIDAQSTLTFLEIDNKGPEITEEKIEVEKPNQTFTEVCWIEDNSDNKNRINDLTEQINAYLAKHYPESAGYVMETTPYLNIPKGLNHDSSKKIYILDQMVRERYALLNQKSSTNFCSITNS